MRNISRKFTKYFPIFYRSFNKFEEIDLGSLVDLPEGYHPTNPSIVPINGNFLVCIRLVNYTLYNDSTTESYFTKGDDYHSIYRFITIDAAGKFLSKLDYLNGFFDQREDIRLISNKSGVFAVYNERGIDQNSCRMGYAHIDYDMKITRNVVYDTPFDFRLEKNWSPFFHEDCLHFIYSLKPLLILKAHDDGTTSPVNVPAIDGMKSRMSFRLGGSSAGEKCTDGWKFLFHRRKTRLFSRKRQIYLNYFVTLDGEMKTVRIGRPFSIGKATIQFVCGYLTHRDKTIISYGRADREAKLLFASPKDMRHLLP